MMEARALKGAYADIFTFRFDVRVPEDAWRQYGFSLGSWAVNWTGCSRRGKSEESMRAYLEWVIRQVLIGGATSLWKTDGFFSIDPYAPDGPRGDPAKALAARK